MKFMSMKGIEVSGLKALELLKMLKDIECKEIITASHKMTDEHKAMWAECDKKLEEAKVLRDEAERLRKKFWNKVEGDLELFDKHLKVNSEAGTIEEWEEDCENCDKSK